MTPHKVWLATLVQKATTQAARRLAGSATATGDIDRVAVWTWDELQSLDLLAARPDFLAPDRRGLELWKPALILAQLRRMPPGDSLLYHDAGDGYWGAYSVDVAIGPLLSWADRHNGGMLPGVWVPELGRNRRWTTQDCFQIMGCDTQACWDSPQLQTTYSLWRNDPASLGLVEAWWQACLDVYDGRRDAALSTFDDFVADRGSQSVLTNLVVARGLVSFGEPHESTTAINHPAIAPVPATDIENLLNRIRDETARPALPRSTTAARRVLFTSIPPRSERLSRDGIPISRSYQERCIASWLACGFEVMSVHYRDEPAAGQPFEGVVRIEVERDQDDPIGEYKPSMRAILGAVQSVGAEISGIINADILLFSDRRWVEALCPQVAGSVVLFSRMDTQDVDRRVIGGPPWGFDFVVFDPAFIPEVSYCGMRIGECWWDYWFPLAMHMAGAEVKHATDLLCLHQEHELKSDAGFHVYGRRFHAWLEDLAEGRIVTATPSRARDLVEYCDYRICVASGDRTRRGRQSYDAISLVLCGIVWSWIARLIRRTSLELTNTGDPHHRFLATAFRGLVAHVDQSRILGGARTKPQAADPRLAVVTDALAALIPDWERRLLRQTREDRINANPGRNADIPTVLCEDRLMRAANALPRFWPVAVDIGLRNVFRRYRGKPIFVAPIHTDPLAAAIWIDGLRQRYVTRKLAGLDAALARLKRMVGRR